MKPVKAIVCLSILFSFFYSSIVLACPGGHGGRPAYKCKDLAKCTEVEIADAAKIEVQAYITQGYLEKTWEKVLDKAEITKTAIGEYKIWKVKFHNPSEKAKDKQSIYVIANLDGSLEGASFKDLAK